jgi:uncharacterized Zn-binding protein involved in type VI secretion
MDPTLFVSTIPMPKGQWTVEGYNTLNALCAEATALLVQTGAVRLEGDHTPIARLSYDGEAVTAEGVDGGTLRVHVIGTVEQALTSAVAPIVANQSFLAMGTTHSCVIGEGSMIVLVDGRPYAELTLETKGAALSTLGLMPPWIFVFQGKPSKLEAHDGHTIVEKTLKRLKKEEPHFVLYDDTSGQWYKRWTLDATNATVLEWVGAPQKAYAWTRRDDVLLHAMALEGLYASNWRTIPTAPGWGEAAKSTAAVQMTIHRPIAPMAFSVHRYDPRHGGTEEVVSAARLRAMATARRHQETVGVARYGALACEVLEHLTQDAPGVDRFVAVCDPTHVAPVRDTLAALGVPTRNNPCVRLAQKKGYHAHLPTVWSLALPAAAAEAFVQQALTWPEVAVADHPWEGMWP